MAFPPKSQREQVMTLVTIVSLSLIALYWNFVYSPKSVELTTLAARVDTLDAQNNAARAQLSKGNVEQLKQEAERSAKDLEVMRQLVPTGNEVPALLEQVSTAARRVGLDLSTVEPEPVIEGEQFDTYRYKITVNGGYHAVAEFLTNVGSLTRIIAPVNLSLAPTQNSTNGTMPRPTGASALATKFEIQTYVARTATPAKKGGKAS